MKQLDRIDNSTERNITFCKRKKVVLKKAMELSQLCEQEVALFVYDKRVSRFIVYNSSDEFNYEEVIRLS